MLMLLAFAELLGMSVWFSAAAVAPQLRELWNLSPQQASGLTTAVQLGFVAGTALAAILNLADLIPARRYFAVSAVLAAGSNAAVVLVTGFAAALPLRFLTGFFLAGVYPPAMKMIATWFRSGRGFAIGTIVGALTLGKALPYLVGGLSSAHWESVVLIASAGALAAAAMVGLAYRDGPEPFPRRAFSLRLTGEVVRDRRTRLAIGGYLGHMWELYAMWALISLFFFETLRARGLTEMTAGSMAGLIAFGAIGIGALGSVVAGTWADRFGRARIAIWAMAVSGACALLIGWLGTLPIAVLVALALVWGFAIVADSAQFSALVTEVAPPHAVGTALTLQTSLGFALTAVSISLTAAIAQAYGWGPAFSLLAIGPALGILAMLRLMPARQPDAQHDA